MNVILFGATGMVGQSVLRECLDEPAVEKVIAIGRSPTGRSHPKLEERPLEADAPAADACFFCLGVSSAGMNEADYTRLTYDLTLAHATKLQQKNPQLVFTYVSGAGTAGKAMWARVKKRTEDALLALFPNAYMFRLAMLMPLHGEAPRVRWLGVLYKVLKPVLPVARALAPAGAVVTCEELGRAMIRVAQQRPANHILEAKDIRSLGR
jgi:uncharacterized protein YbjT (DUF2867 family)